MTSTNSWSATRYGAGGASVPTTGDTGFVEYGSDALTCASSITPDILNITSGFKGTIGVPGTPALLSGTTLNWSANQSGVCYLSGSWTTANIVQTGNSQLQFSGTMSITTLNGGPSGQVSGASGVTVTTLQSAGMVVTLAATTSAGPTITTATVAGSFTTDRTCTTLTALNGASVVLKGIAASTTVNVHGGASMSDRSAGTKTTVNAYPNCNYNNIGGEYAYTITTLNRWAGSSVLTTAGGGAVTIGTDNKIGAL